MFSCRNHWSESHQVSKWNLTHTSIQAEAFVSYKAREEKINSDICVSRSESIDWFPLNAFKPKHWFTGISIRQWPVLLCDCIYQASDGANTVNKCFFISQGQVLLASLGEILKHFPFSFRGLTSLRRLFITGCVFDVCSGALWKTTGCLQGWGQKNGPGTKSCSPSEWKP